MSPAIGWLSLKVRKFAALRASLPVRHRPDALLPVHDAVCVSATGHVAAGFGDAVSTSTGAMIAAAALIAAACLHDRDFARSARAGTGAVISGMAGRLLPMLLVLAVVAFAGRWPVAGSGPWLLAWWAMALPLLLLGRLIAGPGGPLADAPSLRLANAPITYRQRALKAALDRVLGSVLLLLLLPLLVAIALAIRLDSPGPILFRQRRHGYRSCEFEILKFRTMRIEPLPVAGARLQQTRPGDDRVSRVGRVLRKYSLDELPQLINVLQGSMSLVGPRPHAVNMRTENRLGEQIVDDYLSRHRLLPGMTGLSQVSGLRGATDTADQLRRRVELDLHYVEHWSLLLDLKILLLTFRAVMKTTNAY